jgi:hypothetical protein
MQRVSTPQGSFSWRFLSAVALLAAALAKAADPLDTALQNAHPGDVIVVSGIHNGAFKTYVHGTESAPITVRGDGTAVLQGAGASPGFGMSVRHDYYRFENLRILDYKKGFWVAGASHGIARRIHVDGTLEESFKIHHPTSGTISNSPSQYWLFADCSARNTGRGSTGPGTGYGEGFYVGDAEGNWYQGQPDTSGYVTFYNCYVTNTRNDGWDAKEGAHHLKLVNCTQDYTGAIEPVPGDELGFSGVYCRADHVQAINTRCLALGSGGPAFKLYQQRAANGLTYGSDVSLKNVAAEDVPGALLHILNTAVGVTLLNDYALLPAGAALYATNVSATVVPAAAFSELTWAGEGGGRYGALHPARGSFGPGPYGDPLNLAPPSVSSPTANLASGTYAGTQSVALASATAGALVRYTTDGSAPSPTHGTLYTEPFAVAATTTVRAVACFTEALPDDDSVVLAPYVSAQAILALTIVPLTYASWTTAHFTPEECEAGLLTPPTADADGDGVANLLENALASDPRRADASGLPGIGRTTAGDGEHLTLTYTRRTPRGDLVYSLEASADLVVWTPLIATETSVPRDAATETVTSCDPELLAATPRRFLRLRVTIPGGA